MNEPDNVVSEPPPKRTKVDFRAKDTDLGWMHRIDRYTLILVPAWFNILGWVALLGGLEYFRRKSGSPMLWPVIWFSYVFISRYFIAVMERVDFIGIFPKSSPKVQYLVSSILTAAVALGLFQIVYRAVDTIAVISAK